MICASTQGSCEGESNKTNYAYLIDRVAVNTGREQRYGTQGGCSAAHIWSPKPMEVPSEVDRRRAEVGLPPLPDYIAQISKLCL